MDYEYLNVRTMKRVGGGNPSTLAPKASDSKTESLVGQLYPNDPRPVTQHSDAVRSTTNYSLFKIDKRNRPIDPIHLERLFENVSRKNLLREYPIVVDVDMTVIDGQHRLKVAEMLGVPIHYIVSELAMIGDVAATNSHTKHWRLEDYLHYWCSMGIADYLEVKEFWGRYSFLSLTTVVRLCTYGMGPGAGFDRGGSTSRLFAEGTYRANDVSFAEQVAQGVLDFARYVPFYKETVFVGAVSQLFANSEYSHSRMMDKMKYLSAKLVKCANAELYFVVFNGIYNHKVRPENEVQLKQLQPTDARYRADKKAKKDK